MSINTTTERNVGQPGHDTSMGVKCPRCRVPITIENAGGYRTYCENCVFDAEREQRDALLSCHRREAVTITKTMRPMP